MFQHPLIKIYSIVIYFYQWMLKHEASRYSIYIYLNFTPAATFLNCECVVVDLCIYRNFEKSKKFTLIITMKAVGVVPKSCL